LQGVARSYGAPAFTCVDGATHGNRIGRFDAGHRGQLFVVQPGQTSSFCRGRNGSGHGWISTLAGSSVGTRNVDGHPLREVLDRLEKSQVITYRTDLDGAVTFYLDGKTVTSP